MEECFLTLETISPSYNTNLCLQMSCRWIHASLLTQKWCKDSLTKEPPNAPFRAISLVSIMQNVTRQAHINAMFLTKLNFWQNVSFLLFTFFLGGLLFCTAADVVMVVIIIFIVTFSFSYSFSLLEIKGLKRMAKHAMPLRKIKFWQIIYFWEEGVVLFLHNILLVIVVVILVLAKQGAKNN